MAFMKSKETSYNCAMTHLRREKSTEVFSRFLALLFFALAPRLSFAATPPIPPEVKALIGKIITNILNPIIILMFAIALAVFAFGVVRYVWQPENEEERSKGRTSMFWGIIGMFVMVSVYGILRLIINTFGIDPAILDYV